MKNTILFVLGMLLCSYLNAQDAEAYQNKFVLGGSVNFSTQNNYIYPLGLNFIPVGGVHSGSSEDYKQTRFSLSPYIGKELNQNNLVGVSFHVVVEKSEATDVGIIFEPAPVPLDRTTDNLQFGIELFSRHQVLDFGSIGFYLQPYLGYNIANTKDKYDVSSYDREIKTTYFNIGSRLGLLYNATDKLRFTLSSSGLSYINGKWEEVNSENGNDFNSFQTNLNLSSTYLGIELRF